MANGTSYEPGPSFVDNERPTDRLIEMPAWLQTFAAQESPDSALPEESESSSAEVDAAPPREDVAEAVIESPVEPDSILPDWLREEPASSANSVSSAGPRSNHTFPDNLEPDDESDPDGFISEDDLPDWLRAFSDESPVAQEKRPGTGRLVAQAPAAVRPSANVRVPPVENIWLSTVEQRALGPGGTLFALLASNGSADADYSYGSYDSQSPSGERSGAPRQQDGSRASQSSRDSSEDAMAVPEQQSNSLRLLLLTLLVVMLVVAVSFWQFT